MNVLYALILAFQLSAHPSLALTTRFPSFNLREILAISLNATDNGPVPAVCQQTCAPIVPYAIDGQSCTATLCCTSQWEQSYYSCIVCAAGAQNITNLSMAQYTLDSIRADCGTSGISLPLLTFPGQSPNRTLPSASILPSGSATLTPSILPSGSVTVAPSGSGSQTNTSGSATATSSSARSTQSRSSASSIQNQWPLVLAVMLAVLELLL
ncbi:hypothetical protein AX15_003357 [Amanita polypyramis BW_CC]|nr:hypothetical protein AX15_003357 [Amanita polypyramis BW_CC]